jgi:hypothetical protein
MRVQKWLLAAVGIGGFLCVGQSRADTLEIGWSVNGGAITTVASVPGFGAPATFSGPVDGFTVSLTAGTSFNSATHSFLINSTSVVTNTSGTTDTLNLWVTEDGYTLPAGSLLNVESGFTDLTVPPATINQNGVYQAYADSGNNLYGTSDFTNGPQTAIQIAPGSNQFSTTNAVGLFSRSGPYSLTSVANISGLALNQTTSYTSQIDVTVAPLPATASTGLALLAGLGILGGVSVLRRHRQQMA